MQEKGRMRVQCRIGSMQPRSQSMAPKAPLECGDSSPLWRSSCWPDQAACCLEYHKPTSGRAHRRLDFKGRQAALLRQYSDRQSGDQSPHSKGAFGAMLT